MKKGQNWRMGYQQGYREAIEEVKKILTDEIATAHTTKSGKTSRLTSTYQRINNLKNNSV